MYRPYSSSVADSRPFLDVESVIRGLTQDFVTSFNTANYDQVAALFAPDGVFMAPHRDPAFGPKAVERLLRQFG
jgi:ketosteroid isomerase-like protein